MDLLVLFFIALGLSFDSFAVATTSGVMLKDISFTNAMKISFSLAFFQGLFPLIGWFAGSGIKNYIESFDHWVAFILLLLIGGKMIIESFKDDSVKKQINPLDIKVMLTMSIATSIDALIVGFSFAIISINIVHAVLIIGSVTFIIAMLGILFGKNAGKHLGRKMDIVGGLILIAIGAKILFEHLGILSF